MLGRKLQQREILLKSKSSYREHMWSSAQSWKGEKPYKPVKNS